MIPFESGYVFNIEETNDEEEQIYGRKDYRDIEGVLDVGPPKEIAKQSIALGDLVSIAYTNHPVLIFIIHGAPIFSIT